MFIIDFLEKLGTGTLLKIATPVIMLLLTQIKTKKYGSALDVLFLGWGSVVSQFFRTKVGKTIERILEWFIIGLIINCVIFPFLAFIYGMARDNKETFGDIILKIKSLFYMWLDKIKLKK